MKLDTLQKKRRPVQKGKGLRLLHSKTGRKKQRVSATADLGSEVPNLGVARALFIILLLHVAAIGAIIVHNRMTKDEPVVTKSTSGASKGVTAAVAAPATPLPQVQRGEDYYFVATGDSYERVAELKGVNVQELRALNDNVPMKAGRILRIPTPGVSATLSSAPVDYDVNNPTKKEPKQRIAAREAAVPVTVAHAVPEPVVEEVHEPAPRAVIVEDTPPAPEPVRVRPQVERPVVGATQEGQKYTVKSGDTVWSISKRFSVPREDLLKVNGVNDPRKLKIGMTLVIPTN